MPDITSYTFIGDWRVKVQSKNAGWSQRVRVIGTETGTETIGGTVGNFHDVYGNGQSSWQLQIQHNDGDHGWQDSWLRVGPKTINGSSITYLIESEDITTSGSDRDFNDLVIVLEKLGMVDQPVRPAAVWPTSMQMMPDGIFEASLGNYFMAVRVRNIWTEPWPANALVGFTTRCRQWLAAGGIVIHDAWSAEDQAAVGQEVVNGAVLVGALQPWESRVIYFKVDVSGAQVRKHTVEVRVTAPDAEDMSHINKRASGQAFVSRTTYDSEDKVFVSKSDRGTLSVAIRELTVDYHTFKRAIGKARELFSEATVTPGRPGSDHGDGRDGGMQGCSIHGQERLRKELRAFLAGKPTDLCALLARLQCCCAGGGWGGNGGHPGGPGSGDQTWSGKGGTGMEFFSFPTIVDYRIDYDPGFTGRYGPIPFDDPWWKVLLIIIAIILTIAAAASAAADLANRSDDVVIGQVTRTLINAFDTNAAALPPNNTADAGSVDAAVVTLNGNRGLSASVFSYLDAADGEPNTNPINALNGHIDTAGAILTNAQIDQIFTNLANNPADPAAQQAVQVYKSGARTGLTRAIMTGVTPVSARGPEDDGSTIFFRNQVSFVQDPANPMTIARPGDSGSLWIQVGTNAIIALNHAGCSAANTATGSRIEDVMNALNIRFG